MSMWRTKFSRRGSNYAEYDKRIYLSWKHQAPYMQQPLVHTSYSSSEYVLQDVGIPRSRVESRTQWYSHQEWNVKEVLTAKFRNDYNLKYPVEFWCYINGTTGQSTATETAIHWSMEWDVQTVNLQAQTFLAAFAKKSMNYGTFDIYENRKNRGTLHNTLMCKLLLYL